MKKLLFSVFMLMGVAMGAIAEDPDSLYAKDLLQPGTLTPDFHLAQEYDGKMLSPRDLKGKYVMLEFWASWCPDCRKDLPAVSGERRKWEGDSLSFVGVSFDTNEQAWKNAIRKYNLKFHQVSELKKWKETQISKDYHINWIPSYYLLDKDNKVILATVNFSKIQDKLIQLYTEGKITRHEFENNDISDKPDILPSFPGGLDALMKYLRDNIRYDEFARKNAIEAKFIVSFAVSATGAVTDVKIEKVEDVKSKAKPNVTKAENEEITKAGLSLLAAEAIRIVRTMPDWEPGIKDGVEVRTMCHLPVTFKLK